MPALPSVEDTGEAGVAPVRVQEETLASGNAHVIVRHVRVHGSNAEIGGVMAALAISHYGARPDDLLSDGRYVRARRTHFARAYPIHLDRMRGVARAFGLRLDDDRFDFSIVRGGGAAAPGSLAGVASFTPGWASEGGQSLLRRDAPILGSPVAPLELYIMEWLPTGMPFGSIAIHIDDLLSGAIVGVNAAGLGITAVGIDVPPNHAAEPPGRSTRISAIGLHELGLARFVLDTCRTVDEAQAALLAAQAFPMTAPARYLIADANSRSFTYEASLDHRAQTIVDGGGDPQVISSGRSDEQARESLWRCVVDLDARSLDVAVRACDVGSAGHEAGVETLPRSRPLQIVLSSRAERTGQQVWSRKPRRI